MESIKKFVAAGPLENDIRKPRCSHGVAKPLGTRLWTRQILDQVISLKAHDGGRERAPGPGLNQQASSNKLTKSQASSSKHQAPSTKAQA